MSVQAERAAAGVDEIHATQQPLQVLPAAYPEAGRVWPTLDRTSKLVLLLYGCFDSLTCTSIPGSSMNWQAARAMVPSMFSRQPWSTFCSIWWDTGRKHGKMVTKLCSSARRLSPGLLSSAMWVPWFYTEGSRRDASSPVKVC